MEENTGVRSAGLVALERQQVVGPTVQDSLGDPGLRAHGVDGDKCSGQRQAFEQQGNGRDLVGLGLARLLDEHEALAAGPGGTMWSGPRSQRWSWVRREVLPSMAMISGAVDEGEVGSRRVST